ncbi:MULTISPECIES: DNA-3-methyladenine glycosylase [Pseudomonas]|uniref:DNA-3-methyladenine glycosylase II n=1 Tax=Pseudomonas neustonica TaxID=2487346 RepID=A0ABX9XFA8_9PSED|nr:MULTISPECIES: DNA-3-methyladenine glycosylase 2 [Pseudomonas]MBA6419546.1 DNA-3-methyladenine glycosylase 2 [Pseudomonas sp. 5Ae-yellow]ROZ82522.1 DNA-3-methyladenine glycosylase 2 [Pseudomonas neustonica]ROZ82593.1 DNA-3-methyladenine glycosylase 2 [Pseudomonas sp. SSM44]|tara:strand:- start:11344 stop:12267 length:924 start_codon:yes stop_codon:yes gene_type:complete
MAQGSQLSVTLSLPRDFRVYDVLRFYQRDNQQLAEVVQQTTVSKATLYQGIPAAMTINFSHGGVASISWKSDRPTPLSRNDLVAWGEHILGLSQPVDVFAQRYGQHPQIGPLIAATPGLRIPQAITPFEAGCWAIIGQMISVAAAISIRRRLIQQHGVPHSGGLTCHPDADILAGLCIEQLTACGLSQSKAKSLLSLAQETINDNLPLRHWRCAEDLDPKALAAKLLALRGIGPWTVSYLMLRGFGLLDGSLHGDVVIRKRLQRLLAQAETPDQRQTAAWLAAFSPYRALVGAHLWAMAASEKAVDY